MLNYILKRLLSSIITLFAVITITFFLVHAIPGGPFTGDKALSPAIQHNLEVKYGLDKPLGQQYVIYLENLLHGDLGQSTSSEGRSVNQIIHDCFPASAKVGLCALLYAIILGMIMGIIAALKHGKFLDNFCLVLSTFGVTIPSMILAPILVYIFAVNLNLLPAVGLDGGISNYILPAISLGSLSMAFITRLIRSSLLEVLKQDYVKVARAKGLSKSKIVIKHALRNSLVPLITYLGPLTAAVLTGSFVVETVFGIPGIGQQYVTSISNRDYPAVLGITIFFCAFLIAANFIVDILYVVVDPRIKIDK